MIDLNLFHHNIIVANVDLQFREVNCVTFLKFCIISFDPSYLAVVNAYVNVTTQVSALLTCKRFLYQKAIKTLMV